MLFWKPSPLTEQVKACKCLQDIPGWPRLSSGEQYPIETLAERKCVIVTNIASGCGLTEGHYTEFQELYDKYQPQLEILAFPSNDFNQEKDSACSRTRRQKLTFPVFETIKVNGEKSHDIFTWCKWKSGEFGHGSSMTHIGWNFGKFLVSRSGDVQYFGPKTSPKKMDEQIQKLLE